MRETGPVVLDGGMSNALEELGQDLSDPLWTARVLRDAPEAVAEVHRRYYRAGARVATTASYQASVPGLVDRGLSAAEARVLVTRSVEVARGVRDELAADGVDRLVAASVGPYGAVLADGSEYRGRYGVSAAQLRDFHAPRLELLASAGPDLLAVETIPDVDEAEVLVDLLDDLGLATWFSFSVRDGRTAAGQPLADAFATAATPTTVAAVGVNCCPADEVLEAVRLAVATTGKWAVAYPNGGGTWDAGSRSWTGTPGVDAALARQWVAAGAAYVGGCCRVGPEDVARLAQALEADEPSRQRGSRSPGR
jgi:homocysteine S-methyltransferase